MNLHSHSQETTASTQALDVVRQLLGHLGGWGPYTCFSHFLPLPGRMMTLEFLLGSQVQDLHDLRWGSVFDVFQIWFWCDFVLIFKMVQRERERESRKVNGIKIYQNHMVSSSSYPNPIQTYQHIISTTYVSQGLEDSGFDVEAIGPKDSPRSPAESGTQGSVWNSVGLWIVLQNGECWCSIADFVFMEI